MTPDARDLALKAIGACLRTELDDQELAGLVQNVETAIRAAVDEAVAGERGRCLWVVGEAVRFWEEMDGDENLIVGVLKGVASSIRGWGEGKGEGKT